MFRDSQGWDWGKVLRGADVEIRYDAPVENGRADQLWVHWRKHKADQMGIGSVAAHSRVPGEVLCPVTVMEEFLKPLPERQKGEAEADLPLMRWKDGTPVSSARPARAALPSFVRIWKNFLRGPLVALARAAVTAGSQRSSSCCARVPDWRLPLGWTMSVGVSARAVLCP